MNIAIIGCGTVGAETAFLLTKEKKISLKRTNAEINLKYIVDIDFTHAHKIGLDKALFCDNYEKVIEDKSINIVVELIGGLKTAKKVIEKALSAKKHVVTANKALLAHSGKELMELARKNNVTICFEASCGGGIPVIRAITDGLIGNDISALFGILNGTCNFILSSMTKESLDYSFSLKQAQKLGLAESDPYLDVSGTDTAHKLAILASLAFGNEIDFDSIPVEGIDTLELQDVAYGQELGYIVKLLAIAKKQENGLSLCVRPAFISKEHPLSWVSGSFNAVSVYGHATGHTMHYGKGAGGKPTASAVLADIHSIAIGNSKNSFDSVLWPDNAEKSVQLSPDEIISRFYIRINVEDKPGVLAKISACLGEKNISISSVLQKEPISGSSEGVPVVITTHNAKEGNLKKALADINKMSVVKAKSICIQIADEYRNNQPPSF
jgi:homoserine dehydrogenase